ncbi:helix-turn-helix domain-containing protein [Thomasclavelia cocleata]|uniref:helix-turn-helix domain-containing protein n=1 Tax=Thomasclavelia cocleata TaxID=69824 RepID=UPI002557F1A7|nr:helix-turn-helix transcriptional regulator [Thomasclavelia cocleata]
MHFGERLEYLRLEKQLTQEQLAKKSGMTKGMISSYERGISLPNVKQFKDICDYFDVTPLYFMCYSSTPSHIPKEGDNTIILPNNLSVTDDMLKEIFNYIKYLNYKKE